MSEKERGETYTIGEICGMNLTTLRYYDKIQLLTPQVKNGLNPLFYSFATSG